MNKKIKNKKKPSGSLNRVKSKKMSKTFQLSCGHVFEVKHLLYNSLFIDRCCCDTCKKPFTNYEMIFFECGEPESENFDTFCFYTKKEYINVLAYFNNKTISLTEQTCENEVTSPNRSFFKNVCQGLTKLGTKCTAGCLNGKKYCKLHTNQVFWKSKPRHREKEELF